MTPCKEEGIKGEVNGWIDLKRLNRHRLFVSIFCCLEYQTSPPQKEPEGKGQGGHCGVQRRTSRERVLLLSGGDQPLRHEHRGVCLRPDDGQQRRPHRPFPVSDRWKAARPHWALRQARHHSEHTHGQRLIANWILTSSTVCRGWRLFQQEAL